MDDSKSQIRDLLNVSFDLFEDERIGCSWLRNPDPVKEALWPSDDDIERTNAVLCRSAVIHIDFDK